jgi:hypothetical protein
MNTVRQHYFYFKKRFQNAKSDPKFCRKGAVLVIPKPGKKRFQNAVLPCILQRKNFKNSTLVSSITKIPLL